MGKLIAKAWMTLDGVFDAETMEQWHTPYQSRTRAAEIQANMDGSDAMIYGRTTYEMLFPYWSKLKNNEMGLAAKINSVPKYVVSSTMKKASWNNSSVINGNLEDEIGRLKDKHKQIMIDGSASIVRALSQSSLVDEYRLLVHPVIMGKGKKFFADGMEMSKLRVVKNETLELGVVLIHYARV